MTFEHLENINTILKKMINHHMVENSITLAEFARRTKCHQSQLYVFLHSNNPKTGLHTSTVSKIGKYLNNH